MSSLINASLFNGSVIEDDIDGKNTVMDLIFRNGTKWVKSDGTILYTSQIPSDDVDAYTISGDGA